MQISCRHNADYPTSVLMAHFLVVICQVCTRWAMTNWNTLSADLCRLYAHKMQTIKYVSNLIFLQDLRGVKGKNPCWLLPGGSTGREAGRPRVLVWLIRSSAISGGGLRRVTGWLILYMASHNGSDETAWPPAPSLHQVCKVCILSTWCTLLINLWENKHTLSRLCKHFMHTLMMHTLCRLNAYFEFQTNAD